MKKLVVLAATLAMMLAALAPAAIAQEEVDASCEPGVDCQDVFTEEDPQGAEEATPSQEVLGEGFLDGFLADFDFGSFFGEDFLAGFDFVFEGEADEDAPSPEEATAGDGQYESEADDDGGLTPEQLAEGNMEEPAADNQYDPAQ